MPESAIIVGRVVLDDDLSGVAGIVSRMIPSPSVILPAPLVGTICALSKTVLPLMTMWGPALLSRFCDVRRKCRYCRKPTSARC